MNSNGLHLANEQGHMTTVVFLIHELGMDPAVFDGWKGRNSFLWACYHGNIELIKYLAERYPRLINSFSELKNNGLHLAIEQGRADIMVYLIEEVGMDPAVVDGEYGRNSFLWACYHGNIEFINYLAEKYPELINIVDESHKNGLSVAIQRNDKETVKFLIEELEMDPAVKLGEYGLNSFLHACYYRHIEVVKYLAEKYPNLINSVDEYNNSGLHLAVKRDTTHTIYLTIVYLFVELGMDPAVENEYGRNCFLSACYHGSTVIDHLLAERYPTLINSVDNNNDNGLHLAACQGKMETVKYLIHELGMDPAVFDGWKGRNSFLRACENGKIKVVKYLAKRYDQLINTVDENNNNCLHLAAEFGDMDTVVFLIEELGMDPTVNGKNGQNVFVQAKVSGKIDIVKYLWLKRLLGAPKTWFNSMLLEQLEYEYK